MKKGLFGSLFSKGSNKKEASNAEKITHLENHEQEEGRWKILIRYGKEKRPEVSETVFSEVCSRTDRCAIVLMDYNQKEQIHASENMSWLYDTDYEQLNQEHIKQIIAVGKRCYDYKVRCLLAGIPEERITTALLADDAGNLAKLDELDTICFLVSPSNRIAVENIKTKMMYCMKREGIK